MQASSQLPPSAAAPTNPPPAYAPPPPPPVPQPQLAPASPQPLPPPPPAPMMQQPTSSPQPLPPLPISMPTQPTATNRTIPAMAATGSSASAQAPPLSVGGPPPPITLSAPPGLAAGGSASSSTAAPPPPPFQPPLGAPPSASYVPARAPGAVPAQPQTAAAPAVSAPPYQQQQQQTMHFTHQGLNGGWQSDKDYQERRNMIAKIVHLLQQRKPNAPAEWLKKLPQMAKRLEESLYRSATNFEEYNDASTLKNRLQQLAMNIGLKTKKLQHQQQQHAMLQQQQPQQPGLGVPAPAPGVPQGQPPGSLGMRQASVPVAAVPAGQPMPGVPAPVGAGQPQRGVPHATSTGQPYRQPLAIKHPAPQRQQQQQQPQQQQVMVNMADINPLISSNPARIQQQQQQQQQQPQPAQQPLAPAAAQPSVPVQSVQFQQQPQAPTAGATDPLLPTANGGQQQRQMNDRQQVLRHQQQRLLLLRHAAKCQHEDGRCPVTPHCAGMKRLWKHIAECKNQKCLVPHCVSSRYVLSHYHRCKDVRCPVCGPVREAIHRSHEKQKQMQALKQRHQQAVQQQQQTLQSGATAGGAVPAQPGSLTQAGGVMSAQSSVGTVSGPGVAVAEPPLKRQRTGQEVSLPSFQAQGGPQRILQQPTAVRAGSMSSHASSALSQPPAFALSAPGSGVAARPQVATAPGIAFSNGQVIMPKHTGPKPQEDHTLINCFSVEQIETHIASLSKGLQLPPLKLKTKCLEVLKVLQSHQHGWVFNSPVDPVELGLPDYFEVIKKPMDLGTIRKRLDNGVYHTLEEFEGHVHQTFDNAMMYNPEGSVVYNMAKEMKVKFEHDYEKLMHQLNLEEDEKRKNGEACLLCGCEKLQFEPPVFYCNGHNCASKRIRRNSYYYVAGNNQYHWCHQCYQELKDNSTIDLGETSVKKESLAKKKNDETHEESWVQCDRCERWVHQICALFNTRQNKDQRSEYACPKCTIIERKNNGQLEAISSTPMAEDLPRTLLSEYLENHVRVKVNEFVKKKAQQAAAAEGITIEEATKKVQMGGPISIRQVTSMDRKLEVRERMKARYAFRNYPDEFTFRCKCIVVFQNLDGVDVMLFGLYVYEHNEKNPLPNKRAVYISYLDSVYYMRPRQMRTFIYHEILIAYLDYVRRRGFATAHIWACPPLKGDDYILYAKPEDQKTPKDDRLRQWYIDMLIECQMRGIVGKLTNMYDLYFSDPSNDATVVPYMDGDYFPAEVENIIKDIEEGKSGKSSNVQGKKKDKQKQKKKSGRAGTRSAGLDEDALRASGILPPGIDQKSLQDGGRDYVMTKLGEIIQPMKESFIVAFLAWSGAKEDDMIVPKEIQDFREKNGVSWKINDSDQVDATDASSVSGGDCEAATATTAAETPSPQAESGAPPVEVKTESQTEATPVSQAERASSEGPMEVDAVESAPPSVVREAPPAQLDSSDPVPPKDEVMNHDDEAANAAPPPTPSDAYSSSTAAASDAAVPTSVESSTATPSETSAFVTAENAASDPSNQVVPNMVLREGKFAAMQARKRDIEGNSKPAEPEDASSDKPEKEPRSITVRDSKGREVKVVDDDIEELDCEFLNNRQAFLNLCQGNHYQFDQLRRAKHSSMMVLWHLHNRDAPKFVQQCATCSREILQGYRFHCSTCADFDQCQECYQNPNFPRHPHPLKPRPVGTGRESELTAAQRAERQRSIQLHMTLLLHAATCNSPKCPSANCTKMKGLLKHGTQCQIKASGGCNVCKRIWALLQIHARQCKMVQCPVPSCLLIRERIRQLKMQQQAMDDRRRQEMNRAYRGKR